MTRDEFNAASALILAELQQESPDVGKITENITLMTDGFSDEVSRAEVAEKKRDENAEQMKSLQQANMKLFMRIGEKATPEKTPELAPKAQETIDINTLFNEKGELI